jgi:DegV family protein with EDD domain
MQWMAQQALHFSDQGMDLFEVADMTRRTARATRTIFIPDTLEYLRRGGRIGAAASMIGSILNIRPVLYLVNGGVQVLDKVRTRQRAIYRTVEEISLSEGLVYIACLHTNDREERNYLEQSIRAAFPKVPVYLGEVGPVIAAHTGPRTIGVVFQQSYMVE